jgi:hypothetical protein
MLDQVIKLSSLILSVAFVSGCGFHGYSHYLNGDLNSPYIYGPGYYRIFPGNQQNFQYYAPKNYLNQNIQNSINISGNSYHDFQLINSRVFFVDHAGGDVLKAIDGTINQTVVEERFKYKVPICHSVIQGVQAHEYRSFQYINCN